MFVSRTAVQQRLCSIGHQRRRHHVFRRRSLQSFQALLTRLWAHMPWPPQSRQRRLMRLCSQMPAPPQSLQVYLTRCVL